MVKFTSFVLALLISATATAQSAALLDAIRRVETGGCKDPANAVGDGGKAIGPFQIHRAYWQDAVEHDPTIGGKYSDCKDEKYARRIVRAYMARYAPKGASDEVMARMHNGGHKGHLKSSTLAYWAKVQKEMKR
jgi:hypothetical protein